jgi:CubicO group peptidase (beta-lactamase class C family)
MTAKWWRDNDPSGQLDGNYLAYCCLDATPRDFAKFGQLLLNNGVWDGEQVIPQSYIDKIKNIVVDSVLTEGFNGVFSYGLKFWTISPQRQSDGTFYPPANTIYSTIGFDGQYIMIDFDNNMVVVRNSIYYPALNRSDERKMKLNGTDVLTSNFVATLPAGSGMSTVSSYNNAALLYKVTQSINP